MNIKILKVNIEDENPHLDFAEPIENSFNQWLDNYNKLEEKTHWSCDFIIEYDGEIYDFHIDTRENYLAFLDLDGYLNGEAIDLDIGVNALISSSSSFIFELLLFNEIKNQRALSDLKLKAVEIALFPEWSRGYLTNDYNENLKQFCEIFEPVVKKIGLLEKVYISDSKFLINCENQETKTKFLEFAKEKIFNKLFFIIHDKEYGEILHRKEKDLLYKEGLAFDPDMEEVEIYS